MKDFLASLARNIRNARDSRGLSQGELCGRIGVSLKTLQRWESAKTAPDAVELLALSKELDVSILTFFYGEDNRAKDMSIMSKIVVRDEHGLATPEEKKQLAQLAVQHLTTASGGGLLPMSETASELETSRQRDLRVPCSDFPSGFPHLTELPDWLRKLPDPGSFLKVSGL